MPPEENVYAQEGTLAHACAEKLLRHESVEFEDEDMKGHVNRYVQYVQDLLGEDGMLFVEEKLDVSSITGEEGAAGKADAIVVRGDVLHIIDLKYGRGVRVDADHNPQLEAYAVAAVDFVEGLLDLHIQHIVMHICQPRVAGGFSHAEIDRLELDSLANSLRVVCRRALEQNALPEDKREFNPQANACRFCRYRKQCRALAANAAQAAGYGLNDLTMQQPTTFSLSPAEVGAAWSRLDLLKVFINAVEAQAEALLLAGQEVPGLKLVLGPAGRMQWIDEDAADKWLGRQRVPANERRVFKLITPTQAKKIVDKDAWAKNSAKYVKRAEPKAVVALSTDPREPVNPTASSLGIKPLTE